MVARGGRPVAEFAFGLPGEPVPDWTPDEQDARLTIADGFSARLRHLPDEDEHDYHTAAGMLIAQFGRIPHVGEHFEWAGWRIEVVDLDGPRIDKLLLSRLDAGTAIDE